MKLPKCVKVVLFSGTNEYVCLKRSLGFIYGLLLGLAFYELILIDLNFTMYIGLGLGGAICLMLAFALSFSSQIRCITLLSYPSFGGRAGRSVLKALVLAYVISGPIQNLSDNGKEVVRVFACTTELTSNMTRTRAELMFKPFSNALFQMKADVNEVKDTIRSIRDVSAPIVGEFENEEEMKKLREENDYIDTVQGDSKRSDEIDSKYANKGEESEAKRYEQQYLKKIEYRCEAQFSRAQDKCRKMFQKTYDACYDSVTWAAAWLLCWPMKLDFVCNIAEAVGGAKACDPSKALDSGFGEGYVYLKNSRDKMSQNFKNVKLQYKVVKFNEIIDVRDAAYTAKAIMHTVNHKKNILDSILIIIKRILAFIFLRIILNSQNYHDMYLRDIEFDNIYITRYFKKIDARRHAQEKLTLLPLKKIERAKMVEPLSCKPIEKEKQHVLSATVKLLLEMLTATTFILLDRLFFEALDLVKRHAKIEYTQSGHHDMMLEVRGTGMIASILRNLVKGFNVKQRIKVIRSNEDCLPRATVLPNYYLYKIYGTYLVVWLLILTQAYTQRLNRLICAYFYRKREKRRVLFLYNEALKRRIGFLRYMKRKVKKLVRERRLEENLSLCAVLRIRFPRACKCLRFFAMARRKCIICGDPEPRKKSGIPGDFEKCKTPTCYFVHCAECWYDMGQQCLACAPSSQDDSDVEDSDDDVIVVK